MHLFGGLSGNFHVCCHAEYIHPLDGNVGSSQEDINKVWNGDRYKEIRKDFLSGTYPSVCKTACYDKEKIGSDSNRLQVNKRFKHLAHLQDATNEDGSIESTPKYIDIRFGNLCNFKCRTCGPDSSTSWYKDSEEPFSKVIDPYTNNDNLWKSLPSIIPSLTDVYFAGGEPFIQDGHYKLLDALIASGYSKNINLQYNTNLSYTKYRNFDLKSYWDNFKTVKLWPSCDGYGLRAEYNRNGLQWETFENNCFVFKDYISSISSVVSIYSITSMPDLILWCKKNNFNYYGTTLIDPDYLSITCLPKDSKDMIISLYKKFVRDNSSILNSNDLAQIRSWLLFLKGKDDSHLLKKFKTEQQRLDLLREESFESVYKEYVSWYRNI